MLKDESRAEDKYYYFIVREANERNEYPYLKISSEKLKELIGIIKNKDNKGKTKQN